MKKTLGRRWLSLLLACALCLTLIPAAFADDTAGSAGDYKIEITSAPSEIKVGDKATLTATVIKGNGPDTSVTVTWSTSDTDKIDLNAATGEITGKAPVRCRTQRARLSPQPAQLKSSPLTHPPQPLLPSKAAILHLRSESPKQ